MKGKISDKHSEKLISMAVLTVLIVVFSLTPLGYYNTSLASITFLPIFVVIGAVEYGPLCGLYLGAIFGVSSFLHFFDAGYDFGQEFIKLNPYLSFIMCFVSRTLMGYCCGLISKLFSRNCTPIFANILAAFGGGMLNTVFFVALLLAFFYNSDYVKNLGANPTQIIRTLVSNNAYIEWIVCTIIGTLIPALIEKIKKKRSASANREQTV